jgi:hypothetical protein
MAKHSIAAHKRSPSGVAKRSTSIACRSTCEPSHAAMILPIVAHCCGVGGDSVCHPVGTLRRASCAISPVSRGFGRGV